MNLIRPRLLDHHGIAAAQEALSFAVPFLGEDIPLYIDPFLLWKSPSQHENALHNLVVDAFDQIGHAAIRGKKDDAIEFLVRASECNEVGLGVSGTRTGRRIGKETAAQVLEALIDIPGFRQRGIRHVEILQLLVNGISRDRISDFTASILRDHLIDFTMCEAKNLGLPMSDVELHDIYDHKNRKFRTERVQLPVNPSNQRPILLVPKRWLRHVPWIAFESYFKTACPHDDIAHEGAPLERGRVLAFNRQHFDHVARFIEHREVKASDCTADPLFTPLPRISIKRNLETILKTEPGKMARSDRQYEKAVGQLLPSLLYPELDFAQEQARTESGVSIRDLIFYNSQSIPFLKDLRSVFESQQIVFEMKNKSEVESTDIDQLLRYLPPSIGKFGVIVSRQELPRARLKQCVDLWSSRRVAIICLSDEDIKQMVELHETRQRKPIEVVNKKYIEFQRKWPN